MGLHTKPFTLLSLFLLFSSNLELIPLAESATDYTTLVYKGCATQALSDPTGAYSQALSTLFGSLISQSSKAKFFQTTTGSGQTTVSGLFQCRGDLSNVDCYNCVSNLPILIDKLCGTPNAARIQLLGCYMLYEISGFTLGSGLDMLYKVCNGKNSPGSGFEEKRDTALSQLENGMGSNGFFATSYANVYVLGQCEGDLSSADCGDCVTGAVQRSQVECGSSISGQVYLSKCFISYSYYPNGVPSSSSSAGSSSGSGSGGLGLGLGSGSGSGSGSSSSSGSDSSSSSGSDSSSSSSSSSSASESASGVSSSPSGKNTTKTAAIIIGGAVGVGFIVLCLMVVKNALQKDKHDNY